MPQEFQEYLSSVGACREAREWAKGRTAQQAWDQCDRADWLMWWAAKAGVDRKVLVRIACKFARMVLPFVKAGEDRPLRAIETAEAWCEGSATIEQVREARRAAAAADAYAAAAAAAAAYAAAAYAAAAYAAAAYAAAAQRASIWSETRAAKLQEFAALVRAEIPFPGVKRD